MNQEIEDLKRLIEEKINSHEKEIEIHYKKIEDLKEARKRLEGPPLLHNKTSLRNSSLEEEFTGYSVQYIEKQPYSKRLSYRIHNVLAMKKNELLSVQRIRDLLYENYKLSPERQKVNNSLYQLKMKQEKIIRRKHGHYIYSDSSFDT